MLYHYPIQCIIRKFSRGAFFPRVAPFRNSQSLICPLVIGNNLLFLRQRVYAYVGLEQNIISKSNIGRSTCFALNLSDFPMFLMSGDLSTACVAPFFATVTSRVRYGTVRYGMACFVGVRGERPSFGSCYHAHVRQVLHAEAGRAAAQARFESHPEG